MGNEGRAGLRLGEAGADLDGHAIHMAIRANAR
jgi:hypothetical protein